MSSKNTLPWPESARCSRHPALCGEARTCAGRGLWTVGIRLRHNGGGWRSGGRLCWRATRPGIANWKLIERLWAEAGSGSLRPTVLLPFDRFPHACKNSHVVTGFVRICGSALTPCKQHPDGRVPTMVLSETLRPTAFLGYPRGHTVALETWPGTQPRLTRLRYSPSNPSAEEPHDIVHEETRETPRLYPRSSCW